MLTCNLETNCKQADKLCSLVKDYIVIAKQLFGIQKLRFVYKYSVVGYKGGF
jgi:hypothetical protein